MIAAPRGERVDIRARAMPRAHWIPLSADTPRRLEVLKAAEAAGISRHEALGLLVEFWCWVTAESRSGHASGVTSQTLSSAVGGSPRFWEAVAEAGWLRFEPDGVTVPNWDRYLAPAAKARIRATLRQRAHRAEAPSPSPFGHAPVTLPSRPERDIPVTRSFLEMRDERDDASDDDDGALESDAAPRAPAPPSSSCVVHARKRPATAKGTPRGSRRRGAPSAPRDGEPGALHAPPNEADDLALQVARHWSFALDRAREILGTLGHTWEDWVDWLRYEKEHGTRLAVLNFQRFRSPHELPRAVEPDPIPIGEAPEAPPPSDPALAEFLENREAP